MSRVIALYGGSFDPPHSGHVSAARTVMTGLQPDNLIWMPAAQAPHKSASCASARHRLAMSRLAVRELDGVIVSDHEMQTGVSGYTVDTVRHLLRQEPDTRLWLVVGTDMLEHLPRWREVSELLRLCSVAALARRGGQSLDNTAEQLRQGFHAEVRVMAHEPVDISSTELRALLAQGKGCEYLPGPVWEYIQSNRLYAGARL